MQAQDNKQEIRKVSKGNVHNKIKVDGSETRNADKNESLRKVIQAASGQESRYQAKGTRIDTQNQELDHWAYALSQTGQFLTITFLSQNWFQG